MGFYPSWPSHSQVPASAKARLLCLIHLESDQVLKSGEGPKKQKQNKPWNPSFDVVCSHDTWPILLEWKTSHMECQTLWRMGLIEDFHGFSWAICQWPNLFLLCGRLGTCTGMLGSTSGTRVPNDVKGKIPSSKNALMLPSGKQT